MIYFFVVLNFRSLVMKILADFSNLLFAPKLFITVNSLATTIFFLENGLNFSVESTRASQLHGVEH